MRYGWFAAAAVMLACVGCADDSVDTAELGVRQSPLAAYCTARVIGVGDRAVESDYLPSVVACENGAADFEALKAQAVAARSYLYYRLRDSGDIADGQNDQVYSCGRPPRQIHFDAVAATAGEVLRYQDAVIAAFYVAGAIPSQRDCVARAGDPDRSNTERFVTYNAGRRGNDLIQTTLGWVNDGNIFNRGCKSQNGANCLSRSGRDYREILHFYYGEDIEITAAEGACINPIEPPDPDAGRPNPDAARPDSAQPDAARPEADSTVEERDSATPGPDVGHRPPPEARCDQPIDGSGYVDESGACFNITCRTGEWWQAQDTGYEDSALSIATTDQARPDCVGWWSLNLARPGWYQITARITPVGQPLSTSAHYQIRHAGSASAAQVDQAAAVDNWAVLGVFNFSGGGNQWVELTDATGEPFSERGPRVVFDALYIEPAAAPPVTDGGIDRPDPVDQGRPRDPVSDASMTGERRGAGSDTDDLSDGGPTAENSQLSGGCSMSFEPANTPPITLALLLFAGLVRRRRSR